MVLKSSYVKVHQRSKVLVNVKAQFPIQENFFCYGENYQRKDMILLRWNMDSISEIYYSFYNFYTFTYYVSVQETVDNCHFLFSQSLLIFGVYLSDSVNRFVLNVPFLYPLKTSENLSFFYLSESRERVHWNEWFEITIPPKLLWYSK